MNVIIIGANGLTLDREGRLIIASPASRAVVRMEKDGKRCCCVCTQIFHIRLNSPGVRPGTN